MRVKNALWMLAGIAILLAFPFYCMASEPLSPEEIGAKLAPRKKQPVQKSQPRPAADKIKVDGFHDKSLGGIRPPAQPPSVTLNIQFKKGSHELRPESVATLQNLGRALQAEDLRGFVFRIEGHTCDLGGEDLNLRLSRERAQSVRDYLVRTFNLPSAQFNVEGFGEQRPMTPNINEAARKKNRRVVIINTLNPFDPSNQAAPKIDVTVKYIRENQEFELGENGVLTQADDFAVEFTPTADAHVYIYQMDANGEPSLLFPNSAFSSQTNPVQAGRLYRIPEHGKWFYLDENAGQERFIALAHQNPLTEPDRICRQVAPPSPSGTGPDVMLASGWRSSVEVQNKGLMGVRPDAQAPVETSETDVAPPRPVVPEEMFIWQLAFNHQ